MSRVTRKQADEMAVILNNTLALPVAPYALNPETGRQEAQVGCIHICSQNGTNNVYQLDNAAGGCRGLAYGLTLREAYDWLSAAVEGARLAQRCGQHRGL
jgi:hypothetical protein